MIVPIIYGNSIVYAQFPSGEMRACIVKSIENMSDPYSRAQALLSASRYCGRIKDYKKAQNFLEDAVAAASGIKDHFSKAIISTDILNQCLQLNDPDKALKIADTMEFKECKGDALVRVLNYFLKNKRYEDAFKLANTIEEPFSRALAFYDLINYFIAFGLYDNAFKVKEVAENSPQLHKMLKIIAMRNEIDRLGRGVYTYDFILINHPAVKSLILIRMAKKSIAEDYPEGAKKILFEALNLTKNMYSGVMKSDILAQISGCYIDIGEFQYAIKVIKSIPHVSSRSAPLAKIALIYARQGDYPMCLAVTRDIESEFLKEEVMGFLINKYLESGKDEDAFKAAELFKGEFSRSRIYARIAAFYAGRRQFQAAFSAANLVKIPSIRIKCLLEIAISGAIYKTNIQCEKVLINAPVN